jgi:putative protein kinase ArgK-like GTPase of G3E family
MEVADVIAVNKADGDLLPLARHTKVDIMHALQFMRPRRKGWRPQVHKCPQLSRVRGTNAVRGVQAALMSSHENRIEDVWNMVLECRNGITVGRPLPPARRAQRPESRHCVPQDMGLLIDRAAQRQARLQGHMQRMLWDRIRDDERAMSALRCCDRAVSGRSQARAFCCVQEGL